MFIQSNYSEEGDPRTNEELWEEFKCDGRQALSRLFMQFYEQLFHYGMHFAIDEEVVKDAIQKLFFGLWKKRKKLDSPHSIDGYLYVSLRRILLRKAERTTSRKHRNADFLEDETSTILTIEELIILQEEKDHRRELFREALQSLSPRQKEALLLRIDSGMSNNEISQIMGVSDKRVRNLIYEATKRLREHINSRVEKRTNRS